MKKVKSSEPSVLMYLPEKIITDILTRLPVKTLIKFKCVSKSWQLLISTPYFINTHLANSSRSFNSAHHKIILWRRTIVNGPEKVSYYLKSCSLDSIFSPRFDNGNLGNGHSLQLDYMSNMIVGSCNGLVCILMGKKAFFIWNPCTGESKELSILEKSLHHSTFGFGYNQVNDEYKIVQMEFDPSSYKKVIKLFSLRTNSWKKIGDFPNPVAWIHESEFVNGALHWLVRHSKRTGTLTSTIIVSLDLGNETYGEIAEPDYGGGGGGKCFFSLAVVEGCISLCNNVRGIRVDIWVMKEYGLRDSWVKLFTVPYTHIPKEIDYSQYFLFYDTVMGEILLKHGEMLRIYYPKYGTFTTKSIENMLRDSGGATTYLESLVSP